MKSSTLVLLTLLAFVFAGPVGCKKKPNLESKIHGAWIIDEDATIAQLPEDEQKMAALSVRMVKIGMVFNEQREIDLHASMMGQSQKSGATYELLSSDGDTLVLNMKPEQDENDVDDDGPREAKMNVRFIDDDHIAIGPAPEEGQSEEDVAKSTLILRRTTPEELQAAMETPQEMPSLEDLGIDPSMLGDGPDDLDDVDVDGDADANSDDADAGSDDADTDEDSE